MTKLVKDDRSYLNRIWIIQCKCGKKRKSKENYLFSRFWGNKNFGYKVECQSCGRLAMWGKRHQLIDQKYNKCVGKKFGLWTVLKVIKNFKHRVPFGFLARCKCEKIRKLSAYSVLSGRSKGCSDCRDTRKAIDYSGKTINGWKLIKKNSKIYQKYKTICQFCKKPTTKFWKTILATKDCGCKKRTLHEWAGEKKRVRDWAKEWGTSRQRAYQILTGYKSTKTKNS